MKKFAFLLATLALILLPMTSAAAAEDAAQLFKTKCQACHGADGSGHTPVGKSMKLPDLRSAEVQKMSQAEVAAIIAKGKNNKASHAFEQKGLNQQQIEALAHYVKSLK
jgi:cytochrome c6